MVDVRKTSRDVYYFHDYVPEYKYDQDYSQSDIQVSKDILDYKEWDDNQINFFTKELMEAISFLTNNEMPSQVNKIGLIAVPTSKVGKRSPVERSIEIIEKWYQEGKTKAEFNCDVEIHNCSNLLERIKDVPSSHKLKPEDRPKYKDHFDSLRCNGENLSRYLITFILLDDITTKGTIMKACRAKLIFHGAHKFYIYRLALAETVR